MAAPDASRGFGALTGACQATPPAVDSWRAIVVRDDPSPLSVEVSMLRHMLKSKIHRATVTEVNLHYEGSLTVDRDLMDAADILPGERVHVLDLNSGSRFETYVIEGEPGSGEMGVNGAAARLVQTGDPVLVLSYCVLTDDEARAIKPTIVHVDAQNQIVSEPTATRAGPTLDSARPD